ncbi:MAG: DUF1015 family protein, partial [Clostridia bacterium]|nr:DUF1015 family protein [Clostridia bacterium]
MKYQDIGFTSAEILLPDLKKTDFTRWAVVACDQYTSEPAYWERTEAIVGDVPSTLNLILPEVWLAETDARLPHIHDAMDAYLKDVLVSHPD